MPDAVRFGSMGCFVVVQGGTGPNRAWIQPLSRSPEQLPSRRLVTGRDLDRVKGTGLQRRFVAPARGMNADRVGTTSEEVA